MAVYTKITHQNLVDFLQNYRLGKLINFAEIIDGIDNSNFILECETGKFILTIFESRINKDELPFFINFKLHLAKNGICCPQPILNNRQEALGILMEKKALICSFLLGATAKEITPKHCFEVGKILAKLHLAANGFGQSRNNDLGVLGFRKIFDKFSAKIDSYQKNLGAEIAEKITAVEKLWKPDFPSCVAHLDLFPDNVFFDESQNLSGVIDFYFAAKDLMIYDFAIAVNAWCFDENRHFNSQKYREILRGYETLRIFGEDEKEFLKIALFAAALRFLLTRLHDLFFTPENSLVKVKDPQEYLHKMRFFAAKI